MLKLFAACLVFVTAPLFVAAETTTGDIPEAVVIACRNVGFSTPIGIVNAQGSTYWNLNKAPIQGTTTTEGEDGEVIVVFCTKPLPPEQVPGAVDPLPPEINDEPIGYDGVQHAPLSPADPNAPYVDPMDPYVNPDPYSVPYNDPYNTPIYTGPSFPTNPFPMGY